MHIPSLLTRIIGLLALAAALAACSAIKLGYSTLDDVAYWWLNGYVDFTDEQAPAVREDLARLQSWHRGQELPRFAAMLRGLEAMAPGEISAAQACEVVAQVRERLDALANQAEPAIVTLAMGFSPEQLLHLERRYAKNNASFHKEWMLLSAQERSDKRFKQFLERAESLYGRLGEPQRSVLRRQLEQSIFDAGRILAERQRRQQDALETLRRLTAPSLGLEPARALVRGYLARAQESPDPAARAHQKALIEESCRTFSALHASTTPAQREAAVRRLRAYERDLRELSGQL